MCLLYTSKFKISQKTIQVFLGMFLTVTLFLAEQLDKILQKLDTEEIKDLTALLEDMHMLAEQLDDKYEEGYSDGYAQGHKAGYDQCIVDQD